VTSAIEYAISLVAARSWPEKKLRERIQMRFDRPDTDAAMARLHELRMIDDAAWAERYISDRFQRSGRGRHRLQAELLARGVDARTASAVLDRVLSEDAERAKASAVLASLRSKPSGSADAAGEIELKGVPKGPRSTAQSENARLFRRMIARGFPSALVRDLLEVS